MPIDLPAKAEGMLLISVRPLIVAEAESNRQFRLPLCHFLDTGTAHIGDTFFVGPQVCTHADNGLLVQYTHATRPSVHRRPPAFCFEYP